MAGVDVSVGPVTNEYGPGAAARLEHVRWEGFVIPCSPLDLALAVSEQRGQPGARGGDPRLSRRRYALTIVRR